MITCTRRLEFDYAHRLTNHESKCKNVHGHHAVVEITCAGEPLDVVGRVVDFGEIKRVVGTWIDENLDHAFIANTEDEAVIAFFNAQGFRLCILPCEPTAENLARVIGRMAANLLAITVPRVQVVRVRFYETPASFAEWTP